MYTQHKMMLNNCRYRLQSFFHCKVFLLLLPIMYFGCDAKPIVIEKPSKSSSQASIRHAPKKSRKIQSKIESSKRDSEQKSLVHFTKNGFDVIVIGLLNIDQSIISSSLVFLNQANLDITASIHNMVKHKSFKKCSISVKGNLITVRVEENPIIQEIVIKGLFKTHLGKIKYEKLIQEKGEFFDQEKLDILISKILELSERDGYFNARASVKSIISKNNRSKIIIKIDHGIRVGISNIAFFGNKSISASELKKQIQTKISRWHTVFTKSDACYTEKLDRDCIMIESFYRRNGFFDMHIESCNAVLNDKRTDFVISFHINEGVQYKIADIAIEFEEDENSPISAKDSTIKANRTKDVEKIICLELKEIIKNGKFFSAQDLQTAIKFIESQIIGTKYENASVEYSVNPDMINKSVSVIFTISLRLRYQIGEIEIIGNHSVPEQFIRKQIKISEGTRLNKIDSMEIERMIIASGFFTEAKIEISDMPSGEKKIVIAVREISSFSRLFLNGGYSQIEKFYIELGVGKKHPYYNANVMVKFSQLSNLIQLIWDNNADITDTHYEFKIFFVSDKKMAKVPNVLEDVSRADSSERKKNSDIQRLESFTREAAGISGGIRFPINEHLLYGPDFSLKFENVKSNENMSELFQRQSGNYFICTIGHSVIFHDVDIFHSPTTGYILSFSNNFIIGSTLSGKFNFSNLVNNAITAKGFMSFDKRHMVVLSTVLKYGMLTPISKNSNVRILDKFLFGDTGARGFDVHEGIGPKNRHGKNYESLGGMECLSLSFTLFLPFSKKLHDFGMKWFVFVDFISVWNSGIKNHSIISDGFSVRSAAGIGISLEIPFVGKLMFYFSHPIKKEKRDVAISFGFSSE